MIIVRSVCTEFIVKGEHLTSYRLLSSKAAFLACPTVARPVTHGLQAPPVWDTSLGQDLRSRRRSTCET